jgi:hypothetical protein
MSQNFDGPFRDLNFNCEDTSVLTETLTESVRKEVERKQMLREKLWRRGDQSLGGGVKVALCKTCKRTNRISYD